MAVGVLAGAGDVAWLEDGDDLAEAAGAWLRAVMAVPVQPPRTSASANAAKAREGVRFMVPSGVSMAA